MKGAHGVEPWTYRSAVDCSTTELYTHSIQIFCFLLKIFYLHTPITELHSTQVKVMHLYYKPRINRCSSINLYIRTLVGKYNLQINWIAIIKCKGHNKVLTFMNTGDLLQKSGLHVFSTLRQQILQVLSYT